MQHITAEFLRSGTYTLLSASCATHSAEQNDRATARLHTMLEQRGVVPVEVVECSQGGEEIRYMIVHPDWRADTILDMAVWAGRVFSQDAVLFARAGRAYLIRCGDGEVEAEYAHCVPAAHNANRTEIRTSDGKTLAFTWC